MTRASDQAANRFLRLIAHKHHVRLADVELLVGDPVRQAFARYQTDAPNRAGVGAWRTPMYALEGTEQLGDTPWDKLIQLAITDVRALAKRQREAA